MSSAVTKVEQVKEENDPATIFVSTEIPPGHAEDSEYIIPDFAEESVIDHSEQQLNEFTPQNTGVGTARKRGRGRPSKKDRIGIYTLDSDIEVPVSKRNKKAVKIVYSSEAKRKSPRSNKKIYSEDPKPTRGRKSKVKAVLNLNQNLDQSSNEELCPCCGIDKNIAHKNTNKCADCPKKFKLLDSLEKHRDEFHNTSPRAQQCPNCNVRCLQKDLYEKHLQSHYLKTSEFVCPGKCGATFTRKFDAERHLRNKGCDGTLTEEFSCNVCKAKFKRRDNLLEHIRSHILGKKKRFKCKLCGKVCRRALDLNLHFAKKHDGEKDKFQCDICKKWYYSKGYLVSHIKLHEGTRPYKCKQCGYYFRTKGVLRRHMFIHSDVKPYNCDLCDAAFIQRNQLYWHMVWHTGKMNFSCDICGMQFPVKYKLRTHIMYEHAGVPKLKCWFPSCAKEFTDKNILRMHMLTHSENKSYVCSLCNKSFSMSSYRVHIRTHVMERTRRCPLCLKDTSISGLRAYTRTDLILRHVRDKHTEFFNSTLYAMRNVRGAIPVRPPKATTAELTKLIAVIDELIDTQESDFGLLDSRAEPMSLKELMRNVEKLLCKLIDQELLRDVGYPSLAIDKVLENILGSIDVVPLEMSLPLEVRLRENTKLMLKGCVEDNTLTKLLDTHLVDITIRRMLKMYESEEDDVEDKIFG